MLRYTAHHLELAGRHYLPLPKMNPVQTGILSRRFEGLGYTVQKARIFRASSRAGSICIDPSGLCWSSSDPDDEILPVVPRLVASPKTGLAPEEIGALYLRASLNRGRGAVKLISRLESGSSWDKLRASGECGLTPDEHFLARHFIEELGTPCNLVTDFPTGGSVQKRLGTRTYFLSELDPSEASYTLRVIGTSAERNSYLPRDGVIGSGALTLGHIDPALFEQLGDWCSFFPYE